jgi:hypothetical protein
MIQDGGRALRKNQTAYVTSLRLSFMGILRSSISIGRKGSVGPVAVVVAVQHTVVTTMAPGQNRVLAISVGQCIDQLVSGYKSQLALASGWASRCPTRFIMKRLLLVRASPYLRVQTHALTILFLR